MILSFLFISHVFAATSAQFAVSGIVPVTLKVSITQSPSDPKTYSVHEVSNNPNGYVITLNTDAVTATYNGSSVAIVDEQATITRVLSQDKSIDILKELKFTSVPTYVSVSIEAL